MKYITIFILFSILGEFEAQAQNKKNLYPVRVEITEVENRTLSCKVRDHEIVIDQPKAFGGDNSGPTPPEMLAVAYGSCIASTIQLFSTIRKLDITNISVEVKGTIDFSKALGVDTTNRAGFEALEINISFKSGMSPEQKTALLDDIFNVGAAIDNVNNTTPVSYKLVD